MQVRTLILGLVLGLAACGGPLKYEIQGSSRAPGADARIVADVQKDHGQTRLQINASNLAPPDRVSEGSKVYVIFQRKDSGRQWTRVGGLDFNESSRVGRFTGTVPETGFDLAISAEKDPTVASPSADVVFSQRVN
ncbi:MAG: hypothetical protein FWD69_19505 [Polyangiaceae bacterium]|nr:hypothetical protein [Polyangiaceae bacterium]